MYTLHEDLSVPDMESRKGRLYLIAHVNYWTAFLTHNFLSLVWEIVYSKDGSVKEVLKAMQLKGHKSAVTWLCFSPNSEQIITASKDGSIRIWNINEFFGVALGP